MRKSDCIKNGFELAKNIVPQFCEISQFAPTDTYEGIRAGCFEGMKKHDGTKTKIFAYLGFPKHISEGDRVPAVVLVHGGGGHAYLPWVKMWNDRGYAAIAIDHTGFFPNRVNAGADERNDAENWTRGLPASIAETGYAEIPNNDEMSSSAGEIEDMWMYHAVAGVILASNVLRTDDRVDSNKIGIVGVSWGGVITAITIGYDGRFTFAVPIYGSGYLDESKAWIKDHFADANTRELWLAQKNFATVKMPVLWLCWNDDEAFSINSNSKSYLDTVKNNLDTRLSIVDQMGHSHIRAWARPESSFFADSVIKSDAKLTALQSQPTGRTIRIVLKPDPAAEALSAKLYYLTEKMSYQNYDKRGKGVHLYLAQEWQTEKLSVADGAIVTGTVPKSAKGYYIEIATHIGETEYITSSAYVQLD